MAAAAAAPRHPAQQKRRRKDRTTQRTHRGIKNARAFVSIPEESRESRPAHRVSLLDCALSISPYICLSLQFIFVEGKPQKCTRVCVCVRVGRGSALQSAEWSVGMEKNKRKTWRESRRKKVSLLRGGIAFPAIRESKRIRKGK